MARKRNKKQVKDSVRPPERVELAEEAKPKKTAQVKEAVPQRKAATSRARGIRISTCVAGMFLTFVLGLYLGTLMPGVIADIKSASDPQKSAVAPMPPQPAPAISSAPSAEPQNKATETSAVQIPAGMGTRISELESIVSKKDQNVAALIELGNLYFDTNQPRKAIAAYTDALAISPNNADVLTDLGIMYREDGEYARALDCFRKAIAINPAHQNAMYNEGVVLYHDLKRRDEAIEAWKRLLKLNPEARSPDGKFVRDIVAQQH